MRTRSLTIGIMLVFAALLASGCTNYVVTHSLEQPLVPEQSVYIGEIGDGLPEDTPADKKPSLEDMQKFRAYLAEEITKKDLFGTGELQDASAATYEVSGMLLSYKKGSGFLRFLFGRLAGSSEATVQLELRDKATERLLFSGNFKGSVGSWAESGDKMFQQASKDFVKALSKQDKKLVKEAEK